MNNTEVIPHYFDKYKDKMFALMVTSFFGGVLVGPAIIELLIRSLGYRYAMLILAAMQLINIGVVIVFRIAERHTPEEQQTSNAEQHTVNTVDNKDGLPTESSAHDRQQANEIDKPDSGEEVSSRAEDVGKAEKVGGANCVAEMGGANDSDQSEGDHHKHLHGQTLMYLVKTHGQVLSQPAFLLIAVHCLVLSIGENVYFAFSVDYPVRKGIMDPKAAALGATLGGVGSVVSGIIVMFASHWPFDRCALHLICILTLGVTMMAVPSCLTLTSIYIGYVTFGFADGLYIASIYTMLIELFDDRKFFLVRVAYICATSGVGLLAGPVIGGHITDNFGSDMTFYFGGAALLGAWLLLLPYYLGRKILDCRRASSAEKPQSSNKMSDSQGTELTESL